MPKQEILLVRKELQMINRILLALIYRYSVFIKCAKFDKKGIFVTPPLYINIYGNKRSRFKVRLALLALYRLLSQT